MTIFIFSHFLNNCSIRKRTSYRELVNIRGFSSTLIAELSNVNFIFAMKGEKAIPNLISNRYTNKSYHRNYSKIYIFLTILDTKKYFGSRMVHSNHLSVVTSCQEWKIYITRKYLFIYLFYKNHFERFIESHDAFLLFTLVLCMLLEGWVLPIYICKP